MSSFLDMKNIIQGFNLSCQIDNKSPKTIEWYTGFLHRFLEYLNRNSYPTQVDRVKKDHIKSFILYLQQKAKAPHTGKPLSKSTVQGYVRTLKAFFSWVIREEYIEHNPMAKIPVPRAHHGIVNTFNHEQIARLVNLCRISNGSGYRNLTIILILLDSGIRVSELVGIDLHDVDMAEDCLRIRRAKGNKERVVPVGSLVQKSLWKYINRYRPQPITQKVIRLFISEYGIPLTKSGVQQMLRRYGKRAGITGVRCSPHTFRHTFAKNYLLNAGDH